MKTVERYGTVLRIYDNGGKTADRYTIIPPRWARNYRRLVLWECIYSSAEPRGLSGHTVCAAGRHLGKRIHWDDLPKRVQVFAKCEYPEFFKGVCHEE